MKAEITLIKVKFGEREIELTMEEAQALLAALDLAIGEKMVVFQPVRTFPSYQPFYIEQYPTWAPLLPVTTCGTAEGHQIIYGGNALTGGRQ